MTMRKLCLMIATLILISPFAANAGPIAFDFIGICENGCSAFGLNDGDAFAEEDVLVFLDGTDTFAGSNYTLTDIQSFVLFGIDFLARATLLDIETTGGGPKTHRIIELAAIKINNFEVVDAFNTYVDPQRSIPDW